MNIELRMMNQHCSEWIGFELWATSCELWVLDCRLSAIYFINDRAYKLILVIHRLKEMLYMYERAIRSIKFNL